MVLHIEIVRKVLFIILLVIGIMMDMHTLIRLLVVWNLFNAVFVSYFTGKEVRCPLTRQLQNLVPTLGCLCVSMAVAWGVSWLLIDNNLYVRFIFSLTLGAGTYLLLSFKGIYFQFIRSNIRTLLRR